jgi:hypothetical protein
MMTVFVIGASQILVAAKMWTGSPGPFKRPADKVVSSAAAFTKNNWRVLGADPRVVFLKAP